MDFGKLFSRTWDTLWNHPFLILLGVLAALGGSNSGVSFQPRTLLQGVSWRAHDLPQFGTGWPGSGMDLPLFALGGIAVLILLGLSIAVVFWVLGTIARGGMIQAVNELENERSSDFMSAFRAGWEKGWKLLGIGLIPVIPMLLLLGLSITSLAVSGGWQMLEGMRGMGEGWRVLTPLIFLTCLLVPIALLLSLLRSLANRACMLEDKGVLDSYRRGIEVLGENLGSAILLFLLQIALSIGVGVMMIVPGLLSAVCCLLWPLLILVQACFVAFYSILWTLAWREWVPYSAG